MSVAPPGSTEYRYVAPVPSPLDKSKCSGCVAARDADPVGRWPIGYCGKSCERRPVDRARRGL